LIPHASHAAPREPARRALQLDETERRHLFDLARAAHSVTPRRRRRT
jgi:hypothetical protein